MNTVTIKINGIEYNLKGRENQDYLVQVAAYVDGKVRDIMGNNRKLSSTAVATLASINIADELFKSDEEVENLIKKKNSLEERNTTLRERIKEIKTEMDNALEEKSGEILRLHELIKTMEEKIIKSHDLEVELKELRGKLQGTEELNKEAQELRNVINKQKAEIEEKENKIIENGEVIKNLSYELKDVKDIAEKEIEEIKGEKELAVSKNKILQDKLDKVNDDLIRLDDERSILVKEKNTLKDKVIEMDIKFKDVVELKEQSEFKEEFEKLSSEMNIMEQELKKNIREKQTLKTRNKEIKFKLQNYQYKVLDLEKKLVDLQINLAKEKKFKNPLLK